MSSKPTTPNARWRRRLHRSSGIYKVLPPSPEVHYPQDVLPLQSEANKERFEALAEAVASLESNMGELARIHHSVNTEFNEPFASFLYGLWITMFCNNFPGCPTRELYERQKETAAPLRVETLQDRLWKAKAENRRLQDEIASKTREQNELFSLWRTRRLPPPPLGRAIAPPPRQKKRVVVAHDDTYSTNDSFVEAPAGRSASRLGPPKTPQRTAVGGPNLNQPPRYMRGLFEKTASSNVPQRRVEKPPRAPARAQAARASRLASRPPFR